MNPQDRLALQHSLRDALLRANVFDTPRRWRRRFPVPVEALRLTPNLVTPYFEPRRLAPNDAIRPKLLALRVLRADQIPPDDQALDAVWFLAEGIEDP